MTDEETPLSRFLSKQRDAEKAPDLSDEAWKTIDNKLTHDGTTADDLVDAIEEILEDDDNSDTESGECTGDSNGGDA